MAAARAEMNLFLQNNLGVTNQYMREGLLDAGFTSLASLQRQSPEDYAKRCCDVVRKGPGNQAARKMVPVPVEEGMKKLVIWVRYCNITGRVLDINLATQDNLDGVQAWYEQCARDSPKTYEGLTKFTDSLNKKHWFDQIIGYLEVKVGSSGVPLVYVIRQGAAGPDQGFGLPSYEEELKARGSHTSHFYGLDNKAVWVVLKYLTEGTTAWSTIKRMTNNGRLAYMTLLDTFLGIGVRRTLMKKANSRLDSSIYDGRSRNWTWPKHVAMLRECFNDLESSGTDNALSPEMQVEKLVQSFQYAPLTYLSTTINTNAQYRNDFNQAVGLITTEMANLKLKNGNRNAVTNVASITTAEDSVMEDVAPGNHSTIAKMKRKVKQLQAKLKKKDGGKAYRKNPKSKYNKSDLSAYLDSKAYKALTPDQRKAMVEARKKEGIHTK